jgi:hypothetical protein
LPKTACIRGADSIEALVISHPSVEMTNAGVPAEPAWTAAPLAPGRMDAIDGQSPAMVSAMLGRPACGRTICTIGRRG